MDKVFDRVKVGTATTGTGNLTLGAAEPGFRTWPAAGAADGDTVAYIIEDSTSWEVGYGVLSTGGTLLNRNVISSSNAGAKINLTGNAKVFSAVHKGLFDGKSDVGHVHAFVDLTGKPTTLAGYGITDALGNSGAQTLTGSLTVNGTAAAMVLNGTTADVRLDLRRAGVQIGFVGASNDSTNVSFSAATGKLAKITVGGVDRLSAGATGVDLFGDATVSGTFNGLTFRQQGTNGVGIGVSALGSATGVQNVAVGNEAGKVLTTGANNVLVGFRAGWSLTSGGYNVALGPATLQTETSGTYNIAIGQSAGLLQNGASFNILLGGYTGDALTTGHSNVVMGYQALSAETTGAYNIAIGRAAGVVQNGANFNVLIGGFSGDALTTGGSNIAIGYNALGAETTATQNVAVGYAAGLNQSGGSGGNTFVGSQSGVQATTGALNTFIGYMAGNLCTIGSNNSLVGYQAGYDLTSGSNNTIVGRQTGRGITTGGSNTIIGAGVTGLAAGLSNNIILSDGSGNIKFRWDGTKITLTGNTDVVGSITQNGTAVSLVGHTHAWADITSGKPTTLAGYGITDALPSSYVPAFADLTGKPTTLAGYGITDALPSSYVPAFADLTGKPTTLAGYGITDAVPASDKGANNGVATLDGSGKVPTSQLPALAITSTFVVNSQASQLALTAEEGDVCIRTDLSKSFIKNAGNAGDMTDWQELLTPGGGVLSVNGYTGSVTLNAADVGAQGSDALLSAYAGATWSSGVQIPTLTAANTVLLRKVGAATAQDIIDRAAGDIRYELTIATGTTAQYLRGDKTWQALNKAAVGLGNVDNTSDANKPVSTAQQTALNAKADAITTVNSYSANQTVSDATHNGCYNKMTGATARTITFGSAPSAGHASIWVNRGTVNMTIACAGGYYKNGSSTTATANFTIAPGNKLTAFHEGSGVWTFEVV